MDEAMDIEIRGIKEINVIDVKKESDVQVIIGHAGFIKTVVDLYEAMVDSVPGIKFGLAFAEASGACLVRREGNDESLMLEAERNMMNIGAGHTFIILFKNAFPINLVNELKAAREVTQIYCATANPVQVIVAKTEQGNSIMGIVDGYRPKGIEKDEDIRKRLSLLRELGYKR